MKLWIASANKEELVESFDYPIEGIITNPTVIAKEGKNWREVLRELNELGHLPIHLQIISTEEDKMLEEIKVFKELMTQKPLIAKIPLCKDGLKIIPTVKKMGCKVNITTVCTLNQAVIALEANIDYLSVYVGRVTDHGGDGLNLIKEIRSYIDRTNKSTEIIAASVRDLEQMHKVILAGADGIAIPFNLLTSGIKNEITNNSIEQFESDWKSIQGEAIYG
jgi:TalC/MipB family fructose-6-phosphate aldolase